MEPFLLNALLAGLGVALISGTLGCFVVWQRMGYFGDTIAHAALLGVVGGLILRVDVAVGIVVTSALLALALAALSRDKELSSDSLLGVLAHGALALGLVLLSLAHIPIDIQAYLFGDVLAVTQGDIVLIFAVAFAALALLIHYWKPLMMMVVSPDMAQVEGVNVTRLRAILMVTIALVIAVSIKVVGMLLITSMLIIPAAAARFFARSPHMMAVMATGLGMVAVSGGLAASYYVDTPSGPSIILVAIALFSIARLTTLRARR